MKALPTINIAIEKGMRLAVVLEGLETAPRTVAVQPASLPELVASQLSSRERDPIHPQDARCSYTSGHKIICSIFCSA